MSKIIRFIFDISMDKECTYIRLFKIFMIEFHYKNDEVNNAGSVTIQLFNVHLTLMVGVNKPKIISKNHGIS